ncbi:MAG TPA: enoyl-CoA hydratase-related protein, partial [Opitutaceae bacterium]|nr:enoyl-CoA hydratase-related protein [Opitutaceae bacterium]
MSVGREPPVVFSYDAYGIGCISFDNPDARANVFNPATLSALATAIDEASQARLKALILISAKEKIFIAGADLKWLAALPDAATALELSRTGQRLFQRLTDFPVPVVCAIHGACAGGGFELALACHWRIASDAPATQIGLPETGIGTIPGWGGCVRLPRLIGAKPALDHILRAQLLPAKEALAAGLINELVSPSELSARARATALKLAEEGVPAGPSRAAPVPELFAELRRTTLARTRGQQPALLAAIDAVEESAPLPIPAALEVEARHFAGVTTGAVCKNLIHVFFLRDAAKKRTLDGWFESRAGQRPGPRTIKRVGVVGAGVMGSGIAQWLAARGFE